MSIVSKRRPGRVYYRIGFVNVYLFRKGLGIHVEVGLHYWRIRE